MNECDQPVMDESTLIEKLIKIEAVFAGAATEGERISADRARQRILLRLKELLQKDPPIEFKFTFPDMWSRKVFVALLRRYTLKPYRYRGQRYTTVMVQVPKSFVEETLWPEFQRINAELANYLQEVTDRIVKRVLHEDSSEAIIVEQPLKIGLEQSSVSKDSKNEKPDLSPDMQKKRKHQRKKNKKKKRRKR